MARPSLSRRSLSPISRAGQRRVDYRAMAGELNERQRRLWASAEALSHGPGGQAAVIRATGLALDELDTLLDEAETLEAA